MSTFGPDLQPGTTRYFVNGQEVPPPPPPTQMDRIERLLTEIRDELLELTAAQIPKIALEPKSVPLVPYGTPTGPFDGPTMGTPYDPLAPRPPGSPLGSTPLSEAMLGYDAQLATAMPLPPARPAGSSKSVDDRPDPIANPGATNPDVTQENMATTIFVSGWTATVRPPVSFTNALKQQQMVEYGLSGPLSDYEEDHIVPLECGGAPHDAANLWPQPRTGGQWNASTKDLTENAANHALRLGIMTLEEVQQGFCQDWKALHTRLFTNTKLVASMMMTVMAPPPEEP
jgi:hypothetical protein